MVADFGIEDEAHATSAHAAKHPEAPELVCELVAAGIDESLGVGVGCPRNDALDGAVVVALRQGCELPDIARAKCGEEFVENVDGLKAGHPFAVATKEVAFRTHLKNGANILAHATVNEHERSFEIALSLGGDEVGE